MDPHFDLTLIKGGQIELRVKSHNTELFRRMIEALKKVPVIKFNNRLKAYITSVHWYDEIVAIANKLYIDIYCSSELKRIAKQVKHKEKAGHKAFKIDTFESELWTDDKDCVLSPYQAKAANMIYRHKRFLLGDDMGVGKTPTFLAAMCLAFEDGYSRALVICPDKNKYQWQQEVLKFTKIKKKEVIAIDGSKFSCILKLTKRPKLNRKPCRGCIHQKRCVLIKNNPKRIRLDQLNEARIAIANYHFLRTEFKAIKQAGYDILVLDEATGKQAIKNYGSIVSKSAIKLCDSMSSDDIILPMSGTFIENTLEDLYMPFRLINKGLIGEHYSFKNTYLKTDYFGKVYGYKNQDKMDKLIKNYMVRRTIDEAWPDRPAITILNKVCSMDNKQAEFYDKAQDAALKDLADLELQSKINTASILALIGYLERICLAPEIYEPGLKGESCKIEMLKGILEDEVRSDQKVVIFSKYAKKVIPILTREIKTLGITAREITGSTKSEEIEKIKKKFIKDPKLRILICSDAVAYGGNFQSAEFVMNFDMHWNPAIIDQRIRRVYRRGQTKQVKVINLVTSGTVEDRIMEVLSSKREIFDRFLGYAEDKSPVKKKVGLTSLLRILKDGKKDTTNT